jgi:uncharacterized protein (TIGR00725 family)
VIRRVTVFGSSTVPEDSPEYADARRLGRLLAEAGYEVVNGGQSGTMDGVALGVTEGGGHCLGITVQGAPWPPPSRHLSQLRVADDLLLRMRELLTLGDAWIALPGQVGTLAEVAVGWALLSNGFVEPRPLILIGRRWREALASLGDLLQVRSELLGLLTTVESPELAVARLAG